MVGSSVSEMMNLFEEASKGTKKVDVMLSGLSIDMGRGSSDVDVEVETRSTKIFEHPKVMQGLLLNVDGIQYGMTETAVKSLCKEAGVPFSYFMDIPNFMQKYNMERRLKPLNIEKRLMIDEQNQVIRGVVNPDYIDVSYQSLFGFVTKELQKQGIGARVLKLGDYKTREDLLYEPNVAFRVLIESLEMGDLNKENNNLFWSIDIVMSQLGESLQMKQGLFRLSCENGLGLWVNERPDYYKLSYSKWHPDVIASFMDHFITGFREGKEDYISSIKELQGIDLNLEGLKTIKKQLIDASIPKNLVKRTIENFDIDGKTVWDLLNEFTFNAKDVDKKKRLKLEGDLGKFLNLDLSQSMLGVEDNREEKNDNEGLELNE